jgi:hypothetical protein
MLWRKPADPVAAKHYADAKFMCVFVTLGSALGLPLVLTFMVMPYWQAALFCAVIVFPLALWGGLFWSRCFHSLTGRPSKKIIV